MVEIGGLFGEIQNVEIFKSLFADFIAILAFAVTLIFTT